MNLNYLKIAWRLLLKHKAHTLINIIGLGVGFSVSVLMMIFVFHQLSFDNFHRKSDRIFRITINGEMTDGKIISAAMTQGDVAMVVTQGLPELEHACRVYPRGGSVLVGDKRFTGDQIYFVDSTFFHIFDFSLVSGNALQAFNEPMTVVLSQRSAGRYFPGEDPMGKVIRISNMDFLVTGVVKGAPANSHLQFDVLACFQALETRGRAEVQNNGISFPTYLLMRQGSHEASFTGKAIELADKHVNDLFNPHGISVSHGLQPLSRIFLHSGFNYDYSKTGDMRNVYVFGFLAIGVILIAIFNFVNLITAQSEKRSREIGMRKVMGARGRDLFLQFLGESVLVAVFAFVFSLLLNQILIHPFSSVLDESFRLEYWHNPLFFTGILAFVLATGLLSGFYPAMILSRFEPVRVFKGFVKGGSRRALLRKALVIFQFFISVFLVASVLLLHRQVEYMKHKDLGFDRENVITVRNMPASILRTYTSLKAELLQQPGILAVSASQSIPGEERSLQSGYKKGDDPASAVMIHENRIQHGYVETFGLEIIAGRDFDSELRTDSSAIILNEAAVRKLGLEDPIGKEVFVWRHLGKVIGVVRDYNFMSLHNEIDPLALTMYESWFNKISIRVAPGNLPATIELLREKLLAIDPNYNFDYVFVDDLFAGMYRKEERLNKLISAAAILAILISFMGLYALTSFSINNRIKEIGIRKTLGASVGRIIGMLLRDLSGWVVIGNLIAWPLAWYVVSAWKQNFAFQIELIHYWYLFLASGVLAAAVGVMATLVQALTAATTNPVNSLKTE